MYKNISSVLNPKHHYLKFSHRTLLEAYEPAYYHYKTLRKEIVTNTYNKFVVQSRS